MRIGEIAKDLNRARREPAAAIFMIRNADEVEPDATVEFSHFEHDKPLLAVEIEREPPDRILFAAAAYRASHVQVIGDEGRSIDRLIEPSFFQGRPPPA